MRILIAVGSYNRPFDIKKTTSYWLQGLQKYPYVVCVEPQQRLLYSQTIPATNLIVSSTGCYQCGQLLRIKEYAAANGFTHVLKVDDDSWFTDRKNTRKADAAIVIERALDDMSAAIEGRDDIGAVGFIKVRTLLYNKENVRFLKFNRFLVSSYLIDIRYWDFPHKIWGFEDCWTTLNVTQRHGKKIALYGRMALNASFGANPGGLQSENGTAGREGKALLDLQMMQQDYPLLVWNENREHLTDSMTLDIDTSMYVNTIPLPKDDPLNS